MCCLDYQGFIAPLLFRSGERRLLFIHFFFRFILLLSYKHNASLKHLERGASVLARRDTSSSKYTPPPPNPCFLFQCRCGSDWHLHRAQQHLGKGESWRSPGRLSDGQESAHAETTHGSDCGRWEKIKSNQISCTKGKKKREREREFPRISRTHSDSPASLSASSSRSNMTSATEWSRISSTSSPTTPISNKACLPDCALYLSGTISYAFFFFFPLWMLFFLSRALFTFCTRLQRYTL